MICGYQSTRALTKLLRWEAMGRNCRNEKQQINEPSCIFDFGAACDRVSILMVLSRKNLCLAQSLVKSSAAHLKPGWPLNHKHLSYRRSLIFISSGSRGVPKALLGLLFSVSSPLLKQQPHLLTSSNSTKTVPALQISWNLLAETNGS
jgi:hypothetical protein